jgi:hypothetical protein
LQHSRFDENNPYVKQFKGLYEVTESILEKSGSEEQEKKVGKYILTPWGSSPAHSGPTRIRKNAQNT